VREAAALRAKAVERLAELAHVRPSPSSTGSVRLRQGAARCR
jgi:hypothetical protein